MTPEELGRLVTLLRRSGTDLRDVEVKAAAGGLPKSVRDGQIHATARPRSPLRRYRLNR